jgi:hypothetical protein
VWPHGAGLPSRSEIVRKIIVKLKSLLKKMVDDLEKSAIAIAVLDSGANDKRLAADLASQKYRNFYDSLRKEVENLPDQK